MDMKILMTANTNIEVKITYIYIYIFFIYTLYQIHKCILVHH